MRKPQVIKAIALFIVVIFCLARALKGSDFDIYLFASEGLKTQANIYDSHLTNDVQYFYSPFFAFLLLPWTYLPYFIPKFLWLLLISFFLYRIILIIQSYFSADAISIKQKWMISILPLIILAGFIIDNYHMIQVTLFMLWGTLESIKLIDGKRKLLGGSLLGLLINIKLLPLTFLPYLIYRREYKAVFISLLVCLFLIFIPSIYLGIDYNNFLIGHWWSTINPQNVEHVIEMNILVFNIPALVTSLFLDNSSGTLRINPSTVKSLINIISVLIILSSVLFLKLPFFAPSKTRLHKLREISFLLIATVLIFPHQNKYANIYLYPALCYIFHFLISLSNCNVIRAKSFARCCLPVLIFSIFLISLTGKSIVGTDAYLFLSYHKSITIGTLLLLPLLYFMKPEIIEEERMAKAALVESNRIINEIDHMKIVTHKKKNESNAISQTTD